MGVLRRFAVKRILLIFFILAACSPQQPAFTEPNPDWQTDFGISECNLSATGENPFFVLKPGFQLTLEGGSEKVMITVLDETRVVDGIETRVIEEREWRGEMLIEVSLNFFAICEETGDVFYFGEEVDMYQDGEIVRHEGAWLAGKADARAGLIMPGNPVVGMKYFQEIAPDVAMDRAEIISLEARLDTPAGTFDSALLTREGTALNPLEEEYKTYAPQIGLIQDSFLLLTDYGYIDLP